jgi:hypothetical protein
VGKPYPIRAVDISDRAAVTAAASPFDAVIHCASSGGGGAESYRQSIWRRAESISELRPRIFIYTSSVGLRADGRRMGERRESGRTRAGDRRILRETRNSLGVAGWSPASPELRPRRSALLRKFLPVKPGSRGALALSEPGPMRRYCRGVAALRHHLTNHKS